MTGRSYAGRLARLEALEQARRAREEGGLADQLRRALEEDEGGDKVANLRRDIARLTAIPSTGDSWMDALRDGLVSEIQEEIDSLELCV